MPVCDWSGSNPSDGTCVCPAGGTKLIDIGARGGPTDYGNVLGYTCPVSVAVSNWASSDTFPDVFSVSQNKASGRLVVQRSDSNGGWGMGLKFDCCANVCTCPNGTPTVATGSGATVCHVQDSASKFHDCSACNKGFTLSTAAAANTLSTCVGKSLVLVCCMSVCWYACVFCPLDSLRVNSRSRRRRELALHAK